MTALPLERRLIYTCELSRGEFHKIGDDTLALKKSLLGIGFPSEASRRALIIAYELGMNIIIHSYGGTLETYWIGGALEIVARDGGPGIADIDLAMKDGYSTVPDSVREMGYGAGMGLPNSKSISDKFEIYSAKGEGTVVKCLVSPGVQDHYSKSYFHSVRLESDKCKGCTNCIKGCPTEAIRVRHGKAFILEERCIDCGECIRRCPNKAMKAFSDPWSALENYDYKIALVPQSFYGQFKEGNLGLVRQALLGPNGFDEVFDISVASDLVNEIMREYVESRQIESPFISSTCPAVIRLIQVRYPSLLKSVIPCEAPTEIAAWLAKTDASSKGRAQNPSVILISPCPAMITAVRQPVGRERSQVDAVVSARDAYVFVLENMKDSLADPSLDDASSTGLGMGCGRSGGELTAVGLRGLAVHGITQVASLLDELEKGNLRGEVNFVEAQACAGGCVGGCLNVETPFVSRVRIRDLVAKYKDSPPNPLIQTKNVKEPQLWFSLKLLPRPTFHLDDDPEIAEEKLRRLRSIEASLPGLDCGACGAPTCRALAEDIVLQRGALVDCTFKLRDRLEILAGEMKYLAGRRPPSMGDKEN